VHQPHTATRRRAAARAGLGLAAWAMAITAQGQALPEPPVSPTPVTRFEYDAEGNPTKTVVAPGMATTRWVGAPPPPTPRPASPGSAMTCATS